MVDCLVKSSDLIMKAPDLLTLVLASLHVIKVLILIFEISGPHIIDLH